MTDFNHNEWLKEFHAASEKRSGFRELRAEIFEGTIEIVNKGFYRLNDAQITIDSSSAAANTEYFTVPPKLSESGREEPKNPLARGSLMGLGGGSGGCETKFSVIEADCLETAERLLDEGLNPCVLNMASRQNPGGGVKGGAGAQEENLFRRTNLFKSLYQFADYASQYGVKRSKYSYPLDRNTGGIYSKGITVFRARESSGYALLKKPFQASFVSVPSINHPDLEKIDNQYYIAKRLVEPTKEKIRSILRIAGTLREGAAGGLSSAGNCRHDALVLSALGCGAFANPPYHIALLFSEVFGEAEFKNRFKRVVFSIIDDHNSHKEHNPEGNVLPFLKVFNREG
jgi:uncharacterized protein (TIGR02452 family)